MKKLIYIPFFLIIFFITSKSYAENMCSSSSSSSAKSGTIYDSGGASGNYSIGEDCGFLIQSASSQTNITLSFSQFSVESAVWWTYWDYLEVYDGTSTSGTLLGKFHGFSLPGNVTAISGSMYLWFSSDQSIVHQGFTASWTSTTVDPELIASYNFDDDWITNNSLTDQTGSYNGSPGGSVSRVLAVASGSKGDTCYAGSFVGGDIDITGLPVSTATGAKTSVSFWMYWDGTNNVMPMGWYQHDLWLVDGYFGFNTFANDLMGFSSFGLSSGWHHVVAVFTNSSINNKLYIDGVLQTISSQRTNNANLSNAVVQSALRIGGAIVNSGYNFRGMLDNFKIYTGEISQAQVNADMNESNACPGPATPILEYKFDACSLASTVEDTQGSYDGIATGTDSTGSTSILGGRSLDLSATDTSDWVTVPKSVVTGLTDFSFSVWIKTGTSTLQQEIFQALGSSIYDDELEIYLKYSNTIILRLKDREENLSANTTLTDNTWHHLVLTRENDDICLYVDGSQTDCDSGASTGTLSVPYSNAVIIGQEQDSIRSSASLNTGFDSAQSFRGFIDELKIYDSVLNSSQVQTLYNDESSGNNTSTCSGSGGDTSATNFNCVENGANGITGNLYTKTTAQPFSFDIVALQDVTTIETSFASGADHTVTVELVNAETAVSCDSYPVLAPTISQSLLISSSDAGTKATTNMTSAKAYSKVKCRVTDATDTPSIIGCSTDSFSIRPVSFSSIISTMDNASSGLGTTTGAGEDFSITASTATVGYNGVPKYNSDLKDHNDTIQSSKLSGLFSAADINTGEAIGSNFKYDEVGLLKFSVNDIYDDSFSNGSEDIDNGDCTIGFSNTPDANGKVGCKFGNASAITIGRFIPHHFVISEKNIINRSDLSCSPASNFTYTGEKFQVSFKLTAENKSNNTTENYTGSNYAKLDNSNISNFNFGAIDTAAPTELTTSLSPVSSNGTWANGVATITASMGLERTTPNGPFNSFNLGIAPKDSDDVVLSSYDLDTNVPADGNDRELFATTKIRFGRLNIENAHGSELMALPVPVNTEYYNGTSFITNTDDSCTTIAVSQLGFNGGTNPITVNSGNSTASIANSSLDLGKADLSLSAPGANNTGYIDITSDTFITSFPWLNYDWDGDGAYDDSPSARATFGIYKGNSKQIYFREVY